MPKIRVCENNYGYGTDEVIEKIEKEFPNVEVESASCWGYCDDCASGPYVFLDEELIQGDTMEELYDKLKARLS